MADRSLIWGLFAAAALGIGVAGRAEEESPRRLTKDGDFKQHLAWSPDGKQLLFTRIHQGKMGVWVMDADWASKGGEARRLVNYDGPHFDGGWSPDSRRVAYVHDILQGTDGKLQINSVNLDGSNDKVLIPNKNFEEQPRWSPDGKYLAFASTRDGNQEIYRADADGKNVKRLTSEVAADNGPSWSPDGKQLAFASHRHGNLEIHAMDAEGENLRRLTNSPAMDYWPIWSPDKVAQRIAFTSNRDGNYEIYVMKPDGSAARNLTRHPAQDNYAAWSPDGKRLAFISNRDGGHDIYVMNVPELGDLGP